MISNTKVNRIPAVPEQGPRPGRPTYPEIPDTNRHRILEQELAGEQKSLESAKKDIADQTRGGDERNYQRVLEA